MLCRVRFVLRIDGLETGRIEGVRRERIMGDSMTSSEMGEGKPT